MLVTIGFYVIGAAKLAYLLDRTSSSVAWMQPFADHFSVHYIGDLEAAELEAVDSWLHDTMFEAGMSLL
jgi:hypothetical protein